MGRSSGRYTYRLAATRRWRSPGARCAPAPAWLPRRSIRWWSPIGLARRDASLARRSGQARATCQVRPAPWLPTRRKHPNLVGPGDRRRLAWAAPVGPSRMSRPAPCRPRRSCMPQLREEWRMAERVLEVDRLSKRYEDVVALRDLSFQVRAGELFGFVGSNGAGKTTTMRIIMGVLGADAGAVRWAGVPLTFATRRHIGYMPEERGLYPKMRVLEQLVYLAELHGTPSDEARRNAARWLERLGLATRASDEVQALSHGNQQRVQLAAALVAGPEILILDEPFAGLDPLAVDVMSAVLRDEARAGIPVLFPSHQLELVEQLCDRVGIIRHGRMVAVGTVDELRQTKTERLWVDV